MADAPASVRKLAADRGFTRLRPAGGGVEFQVFEATAPDGSKVVLRTPVGGRFQSNPNDRHVDTRELLRWEYAVARHLGRHGLPAGVGSAAFWVYRLDAAVMLALLFSSGASHAELGPSAVDRLCEVHLRLSRELRR